MMTVRFVVARGCLAVLALSMSVATALGQSSKFPDPADAAAPVPVNPYRSAFTDYQPFQEQKGNSWKQVNKEVADHPGMGSMGSMKDLPEMTMPGMDPKSADAAMNKEDPAGHNMDAMGSMKDMPGMDKKAGSMPMSNESHPGMAMAKPAAAALPAKPTAAPAGAIAGTGVIQGIDKDNGKVKLTHEPIAALGWPKMTMVFRLKDGSLANQVKEGDKVDFTLEKSASGYVISGFQKMK